MTKTSLYVVSVIFFVVAALATKFISEKNNKALYLGIVLSLAQNIYFYLDLSLAGGMKQFYAWHIPLTVELPTLLTLLPLAIILIAKKY